MQIGLESQSNQELGNREGKGPMEILHPPKIDLGCEIHHAKGVLAFVLKTFEL